MRRPATALLGLLFIAGCFAPPGEEARRTMAVDRALGGDPDADFARAVSPREFRFPMDHGPHPEFKHEWWYFTGNLADPSGRRFGYQLTLFRIALAPSSPQRASRWAARQVWMAHVAISDLQDKRHLARERLVRDALGLAGFSHPPLELWVEDWRVVRDEAAKRWRLDVATDAFSLRLDLAEGRPPVLQGRNGLSRKSAEPGNASYYYSITRLPTRGEISLGDRSFEVSGASWLDREWSTSALGPEQAGWDWFSMHLDDGTDLMYYQLRLKTGQPDPHSAGAAFTPDGRRIELTPADLRLTPRAWWNGPDGGRYPVAWDLDVLPLDRRIQVRALLPDQLMDLSVRYWEGAVELRDEAGRPQGLGYLEMTGYESRP